MYFLCSLMGENIFMDRVKLYFETLNDPELQDKVKTLKIINHRAHGDKYTENKSTLLKLERTQSY